MNLYKPNELFIGQVGYCSGFEKGGDKYKRFDKDKGIFTVVKKDRYSSYSYIDFISGDEYRDFFNYSCHVGNAAIYEPKPLSLFILPIFKKNPNIEVIATISKKILNNSLISSEEITNLIYFLNNINFEDNNTKEKNNIEKKYISILNNQKFKVKPTTGEEIEITELLINLARKNTISILIGPSGVGKTSIINELAYKIKNNEAPNFIKEKKIMDITRLITSDKYCEEFNEELKEIIDKTSDNGDVLVIDNIHLLCESDKFIIDLINQYIKQKELKIIGTTSIENYNKYIKNTSLNKYIEIIEIKEPQDKTLYTIIEKILLDYSTQNKIHIFDNEENNINIINLLISFTNKDNRIPFSEMCNICDEEIYNPGLVAEIIDKTFAQAKVNNQKKLTLENVIYGINSCNKIYDNIKKIYIEKLNKTFKEEPITKQNFISKVLRKKKN